MGRLFSKQVNRKYIYLFFLGLLSTRKCPECEEKVYCALTVGLWHDFFEVSLLKEQDRHFNCIHQKLRTRFQADIRNLNFGFSVSYIMAYFAKRQRVLFAERVVSY